MLIKIKWKYGSGSMLSQQSIDEQGASENFLTKLHSKYWIIYAFLTKNL